MILWCWQERKEPAYDPTEYVVSPITGELVKISEMAEHMRVSLIDPRWKEQRDAMLAKIRETTKAADEEIGRNLVTLAKTRPDIFGKGQGTFCLNCWIRSRVTLVF